MYKRYLALVLSILLSSVAYSQASPSGSSSLLLNNYTAVILTGGNSSIGYFLLLTNGSYSTTTINIRNSVQLSKYGVTAALSPSSGIPSFLGYLNFTVSLGARPGLYQVDLNATGGDPTSYDQVVNVLVVNETVLAAINESINNPSYNGSNVLSRMVNYTVSTTVPFYPNQSVNGTGNGTSTTTYQTIFTTIASNQTNQSQNVTIKSGSASSTGLIYAIAAVLVIIIFASYIIASIMRKRR
ncbi:MAG: hypothetical protein KGH69_01895 [Candidatus Micrarchaeota archaeon]|nr:hypothetical protein [Candidatus Micrarchaeota archaeon]